MGLLPSISLDRIVSAGTGASMALLSETERLHASEIANQVEHVDLSTNMNFQEFYINAMLF